MVLRSVDEIPTGDSAFSAENTTYIERAFIGSPSKVIIYTMDTTAESYDEATKYFATQKVNYIVGAPDLTTEEATKLATWVKGIRKNSVRRPVAVLPKTAGDSRGVINFEVVNSSATDKIEVGEKQYTEAEYCSRIAGLLAGLDLRVSATYKPLTEVTAIPLVDSDEEVDTAIDAGKLTLYNDGERVVIARGVNSLTTVTEVETADLQKIKINAIQDQIEGDIYSTINKSYIEKDLDHYLRRLQENLIEHRYHTSDYETFVRKEGSKEREIYKLPYYPDRICQWAILQVIEPYLLNSMTKDTYSAIPNRGIQPIINQLRGYKKKIKKDGKVVAEKWIPSILVSDPEATKYCLKLDVRKYYPSIVHDVLKAKYRELFKDEELIWLMDEIIDSISTCPATEENIEILQRLGVAVNIIIDDNGREFVDGVGIPIGNYVSQYDGNFNLSVVDHWLKEVKGVKYYFRYMDDMVIFGSSKEELHKLKRELDEFMAVNLKQVLKHNWQVFPTKVRGVDFVGYRFFGEYTLLRKSTCKTFKRRMLSISSKRENNVSPTYSEWCSFNSYVGWLQHCDSFRLYQKYVEPNVEYMHNYYLKEVKGNAEICKRKNYSGERKAS